MAKTASLRIRCLRLNTRQFLSQPDITWLIARALGAASIETAALNPSKSIANQARSSTRPPGTSIADEHGPRGVNVTNHREALMYKNFALLSISAALLFSLFFFGVGHAFQIDLKKQARMNAMVNTQTTQVSNTSRPCGGRDAAACRKHSQRESILR